MAQAVESAAPQVGHPAPTLEVVLGKDAAGKPMTFRLSEAVKNGPVIVAFIPGAFTSTCHQEMCDFRDAWGEFAKLKSQFIAVSPDGPHVLKAWAKELGTTLPMGSDMDKANLRRWGVVWSAWWGTVPRRATFVVDRAGVVRFAEVLQDADLLPNYTALKTTLQNLR